MDNHLICNEPPNRPIPRFHARGRLMNGHNVAVRRRRSTDQCGRHGFFVFLMVVGCLFLANARPVVAQEANETEHPAKDATRAPVKRDSPVKVVNPATSTGKGQLHRDFGFPGAVRSWERFSYLNPRIPRRSRRNALGRGIGPQQGFGFPGTCGHRFSRLGCQGCGGAYAYPPTGMIRIGGIGDPTGYTMPLDKAYDLGVAPEGVTKTIETQAQRAMEEYLFVVDSGDDAFFRADYNEAARHYLLACELNQGDPTARLNAAHALTTQGRYAQAGSRIRRALSLQPKIAHFMIDIRSAYGRPADFERHLADLQAATEKSDNPKVWLLLAYYLYNSGAGDIAVDVLEHAAELAPDDRVIERFLAAAKGE